METLSVVVVLFVSVVPLSRCYIDSRNVGQLRQLGLDYPHS
jgi:hypothetical protein